MQVNAQVVSQERLERVDDPAGDIQRQPAERDCGELAVCQGVF
jgi:hypothetical protein